MLTVNDRLSPMEKLLANIPLLSAAIAFICAQALKPIINALLGNGWKWRFLTTTGGMPSSHSAAAAALTVSIGMTEGIGSTAFAICVFIALVIMNDAMNVRYETGKQAWEKCRLQISCRKDKNCSTQEEKTPGYRLSL